MTAGIITSRLEERVTALRKNTRTPVVVSKRLIVTHYVVSGGTTYLQCRIKVGAIDAAALGPFVK